MSDNELLQRWTKAFGTVKDYIEKLERENAALRADKERLDWMEENGSYGYVVGTTKSDYWSVDLPLSEKTTLRAAIDAARKEEQL